MHDGAPAHFALNVQEFSNMIIAKKWIGRALVTSSPTSTNFNPFDYYSYEAIQKVLFMILIIKEDLLTNFVVRAISSYLCIWFEV